jgi:tetratricopeptide (TPR) repeat protein
MEEVCMKRRIKRIVSMYLLCILISGCAAFQGNKPQKDLNEGIGLYNKGDYENAIMYFKECIAVDKNNSTCHLWMGKVLLERGKEGDLKSALIEFKKAVDTSKDREKTLAQIRSFFFERADKYSQKGDIYMESRCYLAYTENFNKNDADAYIKLGNVMLAMGNPLGALYYAKKAKALDPNNKAVRELMDTLNSPTH